MKFTKKLTLILQATISLTAGALTILFASLLQLTNLLKIFLISSIACFISLTFTIWNIKKTIQANIENFSTQAFFENKD